MTQVFNIAFFEHIKILVVGILLYAIIYSFLKKASVLGSDDKVNSLVALLSAIIVSFSGVATYVVSYATNWFFIIFFILFLIIVLLLFLGAEWSTVADITKKNSKTIFVVLLLVFSVILVKGFFAVNNSFDLNEPPNSNYNVDASFNTGVDDITNSEVNENMVDSIKETMQSDIAGVAFFLLIIGGAIYLIGRK